MQPSILENTPALWRKIWPQASPEDHKYTRGQAVIWAGKAAHSGAALLASEAALRAGAGLAILLAPPECLALYAMAAKRAIIKRTYEETAELMDDSRPQAWLIGPGLGVSTDTRGRVLETLQQQKATVLDADALTSFADSPDALFAALHPHCLLTPHEGEFTRLFPDIQGTKTERAVAAAKRCGAVMLLKGAETIIATPEGVIPKSSQDLDISAQGAERSEGDWGSIPGRTECNRYVIRHYIDAPQLATAGSGDVLAGICVGLMAQAMPVAMAAAAAAWIHGQAAQRLGMGMIADDLVIALPDVIKALHVDRPV